MSYIGRNVDEVLKELREANPDKKIFGVTIGDIVILDVQVDRIRVWYDYSTRNVISIETG